MDVSIIIVSYNTRELLQDCLDSILEKTQNVSYEIIVVDNCSSDNSVSMLKERFPTVKRVESNENLGFGKGNNLGSEYASGKYLFFLNSDTLLINNAIKILFDFAEMEINVNVGCLGGNLYYLNGSPNFSYANIFPSLRSIFLYRSYLYFILRPDFFNNTTAPKEVAIIIGADLLIAKDKFNLVGGFDPEYFMYVEEGDLQYRLKKVGFISMSVPEAKIVHLQGASSDSYFKLRSEISGYLLYFEKHYGKVTLFIYRYLEMFFAAIRYFAFSLKGDTQRRRDYMNILRFLWHTNDEV